MGDDSSREKGLDLNAIGHLDAERGREREREKDREKRERERDKVTMYCPRQCAFGML